MKTKILTLLIGAIALTALAFTPTGCDTGRVAVKFTLHAYSGPIHVENVCLTAFTHAGDSMVIEARDNSGLIFRGDFEIWP